jgi:hypothetical protein
MGFLCTFIDGSHELFGIMVVAGESENKNTEEHDLDPLTINCFSNIS